MLLGYHGCLVVPVKLSRSLGSPASHCWGFVREHKVAVSSYQLLGVVNSVVVRTAPKAREHTTTTRRPGTPSQLAEQLQATGVLLDKSAWKEWANTRPQYLQTGTRALTSCHSQTSSHQDYTSLHKDHHASDALDTSSTSSTLHLPCNCAHPCDITIPTVPPVP
jgi:hypothetical protein